MRKLDMWHAEENYTLFIINKSTIIQFQINEVTV